MPISKFIYVQMITMLDYLSLFNDSSVYTNTFVKCTVKGKGISFAENNNDWHHIVLTKANYDEAMEGLLESGGKV